MSACHVTCQPHLEGIHNGEKVMAVGNTCFIHQGLSLPHYASLHAFTLQAEHIFQINLFAFLSALLVFSATEILLHVTGEEYNMFGRIGAGGYRRRQNAVMLRILSFSFPTFFTRLPHYRASRRRHRFPSGGSFTIRQKGKVLYLE